MNASDGSIAKLVSVFDDFDPASDDQKAPLPFFYRIGQLIAAIQ